MSAWPEAVWIVKNLNKNFNFENQYNLYRADLSQLNQRVTNLNTELTNFEKSLYTFMAQDSGNNTPEGISSSFKKGNIWLVLN